MNPGFWCQQENVVFLFAEWHGGQFDTSMLRLENRLGDGVAVPRITERDYPKCQREGPAAHLRPGFLVLGLVLTFWGAAVIVESFVLFHVAVVVDDDAVLADQGDCIGGVFVRTAQHI